MSVVGAFSAAELNKVAQITCIVDLASWAQLPLPDVARLLGLREDEFPTAPVSLLAVFSDEEFAGLMSAWQGFVHQDAIMGRLVHRR
eukprot:4367072-Amphidinium_carterae.1